MELFSASDNFSGNLAIGTSNANVTQIQKKSAARNGCAASCAHKVRVCNIVHAEGCGSPQRCHWPCVLSVFLATRHQHSLGLFSALGDRRHLPAPGTVRTKAYMHADDSSINF